MSYCIMRLEKRKANNITGMQIHNDRATENHKNEDINKELSHLNYDLIKCESYKKKINEELEKRYTVNKSLRKDANLCVEVIFTSDNEFFKKLSPEQERFYFEKSLEFLKDFAGEKNIISATVHKDETTPHLHAVFMPLTDDGRLNYKDFINTKYDLINLQDKYYEKMSEFFPELERGKSSSETLKKHLSVEQYKYEQENQKLEKLKKEHKEQAKIIKNIEETASNFYSVKSLVENIEENHKILFSNSYKISDKDLRALTALASSSKENEIQKEKLLEENKKLKEDLTKITASYRKYFSLYQELSEFKVKFEDYYKRLEKEIDTEKLNIIKDENNSYIKIKSFKTNYEVNKYLEELEKKGFNKVNSVDKKFILDKSQTNETARSILSDTSKTTKSREKKSVWEKKVDRDKGWGIGD